MRSFLFTNGQKNPEEALERDGTLLVSSAALGAFVIRRATKEDWIISIVSDFDAAGKINWQPYPGTFFYFADLGSGWSVFLKADNGGIGCYLELHRNGEAVLIEDRGDILERLMARVAERFGAQTVMVDLLADPEARNIYEKEQALISEALTVLANFRPA
jgi:hypothetical protein